MRDFAQNLAKSRKIAKTWEIWDRTSDPWKGEKSKGHRFDATFGTFSGFSNPNWFENEKKVRRPESNVCPVDSKLSSRAHPPADLTIKTSPRHLTLLATELAPKLSSQPHS